MTKEEKLDTIDSIFWDYIIDSEEYSHMAEHPETADEKELWRFFVRAFECVRWHELVCLFGIGLIKSFLNDEMRKMIRKELGKRFDTIAAILRGEPVPVTREDIEFQALFI